MEDVIFVHAFTLNKKMDWNWFNENMENNKDIEILFSCRYNMNFKMFKYAAEHIKFFRYNKYYERIYFEKSSYLRFISSTIHDSKEGKLIEEYIKKNYTKEEYDKESDYIFHYIDFEN